MGDITEHLHHMGSATSEADAEKVFGGSDFNRPT
jgi:hypothetical protein